MGQLVSSSHRLSVQILDTSNAQGVHCIVGSQLSSRIAREGVYVVRTRQGTDVLPE
jgi:hypothetical protein